MPLGVPELPDDASLLNPAFAAAVLVALDELDEELAADPLPLTLTAVTFVLLPVVVVGLDLPSLHTVSVLAFALRTCPGATALWASPCVTLWKFSLTSPSEFEMRTTPALCA